LIHLLSQFVSHWLPARLTLLLLLPLGSASTASAQNPTATIGPTAQILPPPSTHVFPDGQAYVYTVEWHLFTTGTATVSLNIAESGKKVTAMADSAGVVNVLYAVHDHFEARFDPSTFCSLGLIKHTEEGSHKRDTQVDFDYPRRKSVLREKNLKTGESKQIENDIPPCVTDVVTGFYYLASLPLKPGNYYTFPVNDGGKTAEVTAQVEGKDQVKAPAGSFATIRVSAEANSGPLQGRGKIWVWFTDDANRTPVQMRAKLAWGTMLFRLQRVDHH
jgi:Protein of unknown function (DUF3108)